jgi:hypothetical protein
MFHLGWMRRPMLLRMAFALACLVILNPSAAWSWGFEGHRVVGSIADKLLKPNAKRQVQQILGERLDLRKVAPWPDCVRSVVRHDDGSFRYEVNPEHLEFEVPCTPFNSAEERARMVDYAARNWFTCPEAPCHTTFHFVDVPIQENGFDRSRHQAGTNDHDLVAAIGAAIAILSDQPIPPPFPFALKDKKNALILLAHLIGDLHQPLHVGSVYLDENGNRVDPGGPETETAGANFIQDQNINLHHEWDDIPTDLGDASTRELMEAAKATPATQGPLADWPSIWASESILVARDAFAGLTFQRTQPPPRAQWTVSFDDHDAYLRAMDAIKRRQLAKGGARLAEILNAIWP